VTAGAPEGGLSGGLSGGYFEFSAAERQKRNSYHLFFQVVVAVANINYSLLNLPKPSKPPPFETLVYPKRLPKWVSVEGEYRMILTPFTIAQKHVFQ